MIVIKNRKPKMQSLTRQGVFGSYKGNYDAFRRFDEFNGGVFLVPLYYRVGYLAKGLAFGVHLHLRVPGVLNLSKGTPKGFSDRLRMLFGAEIVCLECVVFGLPQTTNAPPRQAPDAVDYYGSLDRKSIITIIA